MYFRWLGVAGIELVVGEEKLAIDPYLTRAPFWKLCFGHLAPDAGQICDHLPACDYLLVTHAHFDHVMDAAEVLGHSGAQGYGSSNACRLMAAMGASHENLHVISCGEHLEAGHFRVEVYRQSHPRTPIDRWINAALQPNLDPPLRLTDFRMDESFGFLIQAQGLRLLLGDIPIAADVLFTIPMKSRQFYDRLLPVVQPKVVIPLHWDNLCLPLDKVLSKTEATSRMTWPWMRIYLRRFRRHIESLSGGCRVLVPNIFQPYELESEILPGSRES